ncbi:salivary glue protein Sgs-3-like [Haliotis cracherodii]|uniref:salivary glue protein Sgs-3-like n=1 Tax=Haliotis cracherodii TaxID=6455 RepID=UPI0039E73C17
MVALGNGQNSGHESGVFKTSSVPLVKLCHRLCWYYTYCKAYTWVRGTGSCQLSSDTRITSPYPFSVTQHHVYSDARAPRGLKSAHPCTRRPCDVVEVCVPVAAASRHLCLRRGAVHAQHFESLDVTSTASTTTTPTTAASPTSTAPTTTESTASDTTTATATTTTASPRTTTAATTTTVTTPPTTAPTTTTTMPSLTSTATTAATTDATTTTAAITTTVATTTTVYTTTTEITTVTTTSTTTTTPTTTTNKHACVSDCKGLTGYYHSCTSCSKYVICSINGLSELSCGPTTEFDDIKKICTFAPSATCN